MQKAKQFAEDICLSYCAQSSSKMMPRLKWSIQDAESGEGFSSTYSGGVLSLGECGPIGAAFGASQLLAGASSGHLAEVLGQISPRFPLRPLWINCENPYAISPSLSVNLPKQLPDEAFCRRVIELGYNSVIFGARDTTSSELKCPDMQEMFSLFHDFGLKIILKPAINLPGISCCPINKDYQELVGSSLKALLARFPDISSIFWESMTLHPEFYQHPSAREFTHFDLIQAEVKMIENALKKQTSLIYYIPVSDFAAALRQASWMPALCDRVDNRTTIAFPAVAGDPCLDHLPPHPFWDALRASPDCSATPLMPILNAGSVKQGEGLWPALTFDIAESYIGRCYRHCFAGVAVITSRIPSKGSLLDCNLWVAGQALWHKRSPELLAETWFLANRPDLNFGVYRDILKKVRSLVIELSLLKSLTQEKNRDTISTEESRSITEGILARLKLIQLSAEKCEAKLGKKRDKLLMQDYVTFFTRDAKRMVMHFLQCINIPMSNLLGPEDFQESFWTQAVHSGGQGLRSGMKIAFLEEPCRGPAGSKMESIWLENRGC